LRLAFFRLALAFPLPDHFGDINEMAFDTMAVIKTGRFGLFDDLLEVAIIRIAENLCKICSTQDKLEGMAKTGDAIIYSFI
jgi:hypothetical protein